MQNDFEKQVQQKMEELDLVPSTPVWEKIELRIRDKQDRRRYVLWFMLLCLLIGGGITWLSLESDDVKRISNTESLNNNIENKNSNTLSSNPETSTSIGDQPITEKEKQLIKENQTITQTEKTEKIIAPNNIETNNEPKVVNNTVVTNSKNKESKINKTTKPKVVNVSTIPTNSVSLANKKTKPAKIEKNKVILVPAIDKVITSDSKIPVETKPEKPGSPSQQKNGQPGKTTPDTADAKKAVTVNAVVSTDPVNKNEVIAENTLPAVDSINIQTDVVLAKPKTKKSKWQFGIRAGVGVSDLGESISFSNESENKSAFLASPQAASYDRVPYSRGYTPPSVVKKNVAYSISAVVKKLIGKKLQISSGVGYDHYSTLLENGRMDSVNVRVGTNSGNSQSFTAGSSFSNYSNKFHFITVPLNVHFRVFKKTPLNLFGGVAVKYLVATNAIEYDHLTYLYSSDINAYNRTQFFSNFGLEYAVVNKKNQLLLGPEITYGISKHLSSGTPQHLYSIGLRAEFLFQKN